MATEPTPGPRNMAYIVGKRIKMQGFIVMNYWDMREQFRAEMTQELHQALAAALGKLAETQLVHAGDREGLLAFYQRFGFAQVGVSEFLFGGQVYVDPIYAAPVPPDLDPA